MKFAKINRTGYPANTICAVVKYGANESVVRLPNGEKVTLYTSFLYQDGETLRHERNTSDSKAREFLSKHPTRKR